MTSARREQGCAVWTHAGGQRRTLATFTCVHCNDVTLIPEGAKPADCGGFCLLCMRSTCTACATAGGCTPFERRLEQIEARDRLLTSIGV